MRKNYEKPCMGISRFSKDDVVKASGKTTLEMALDQLGNGLNGKDQYYLKNNSSSPATGTSVFGFNK